LCRSLTVIGSIANFGYGDTARSDNLRVVAYRRDASWIFISQENTAKLAGYRDLHAGHGSGHGYQEVEFPWRAPAFLRQYFSALSRALLY